MLSESQEDSSEVTAGEMRKTRNREITGTALVISYNGVTDESALLGADGCLPRDLI
jgi:hypothetical protein